MNSPIESRLDQLSAEQRLAGVDAPPERVYVFHYDALASPAMYLEVALDEADPSVPVIVHNLTYYEDAMNRWDVGLVELLVLNELHELTHWAMTDEEREHFDRKSRRSGRPDGDWLNPPLFALLEWLPVDGPDVVDTPPSVWERIAATIRDRVFGGESPRRQ